MNKKAQEYLDSYGFNYIDATKVIDDYNFEDRKAGRDRKIYLL